MSHRIVSLVLVGLLATLPSRSPAEEPPRRADWSWLRLGRDTVAEVERRAGPPRLHWKTKIDRGVLDPSPRPTVRGPLGIPLPRVAADPATAVEVCVLDFGNDKATGARQWLVFQDDRLFYAILPTEADDDTVSGILRRYGEKNRSFWLGGAELSCASSRLVLEVPDARLAFLCKPGPGESIAAIAERVVWADAADLAPELRTAWRLPERKLEDRARR